MVKKSLVISLMAGALALTACGGGASAPTTTAAPSVTETEATKEMEATTAESSAEEEKETKAEAAAAPGEAAGFEEFPIGDDQEVGPLIVSGVYFQPVDMEPAGNSLSKEEADCHIEADITAGPKGTTLGYGVGDFVPWLKVKAYVQKHGSDKVQEVAFMPMNASDGPHYGANFKFEDGLGVYNVKFEVAAPGNDYLLHVDKETGVTGRFWTEPLVAEWDDFEWAGPQW